MNFIVFIKMYQIKAFALPRTLTDEEMEFLMKKHTKMDCLKSEQSVHYVTLKRSMNIEESELDTLNLAALSAYYQISTHDHPLDRNVLPIIFLVNHQVDPTTIKSIETILFEEKEFEEKEYTKKRKKTCALENKDNIGSNLYNDERLDMIAELQMPHINQDDVYDEEKLYKWYGDCKIFKTYNLDDYLRDLLNER